MSDNQNAPAGQDTGASGTGSNDSQSNAPNDVQAILKKQAELMAELKSSKARLKEFQDRDKLREEEDAKKRGDFEQLVKTRDEEIQKLQGELSTHKSRMESATKLAAVIKTAGTDIEDKWFSIIDLSQVVIDPNTGEVDQMSVTKTVETLRKSWPEMFKQPNPPTLPPGAPRGNMGGKIAFADWKKLPAKEMKKYGPQDIIY